VYEFFNAGIGFYEGGYGHSAGPFFESVNVDDKPGATFFL
jgi:hypothetical protein